MENVETWLPVVGYEGSYEVSDLGRVRGVERTVVKSNGRICLLTSKLLSPSPRNGYPTVTLSKGGQRRKEYVHRMVLLAFVGPPPEGAEACHGNDIRTDSRLSNLRWDSHLANVGEMLTRGRFRNHLKERTHCRRRHLLTLTKDGSRRICRECVRINERERYHRAKLIS